MRIVYRSTAFEDDDVAACIEGTNDRILDIDTLTKIPADLSSTGYYRYKLRTKLTFAPDSFRPHNVNDPPIPAVRMEYELGGKKCVSTNSASGFTSKEELKRLFDQEKPTEFTVWIWDFCPDNRDPSIKMISLLCADE